MRAERVIAAARAWLETPFVHQRRLKGRACDCAGLVMGVGEELGLVEFDAERWRPFQGYPPNPRDYLIVKFLKTFFELLPDPRAARAGDVLLFSIGDEPRHLGILTDAGSVIHADNRRPARRVIETDIDPSFRVAFAARYPGGV